MREVKIRQYKDQVYYLDSDGFHFGWIKKAIVTSDQFEHLTIRYFVVHSGDNYDFQGKELPPSKVFDTKDEMLQHYRDEI